MVNIIEVGNIYLLSESCGEIDKYESGANRLRKVNTYLRNVFMLLFRGVSRFPSTTLQLCIY